MCDYSLHAVATRPAEVAETLVSTKFQSGTRGFASPDNPRVAVCLRPGTEVAFEKDVRVDGLLFGTNIGDRLARFRQVDLDRPAKEAATSVRLRAREEHLLVAASDTAPGLDTFASLRRLVGRQLGVEA